MHERVTWVVGIPGVNFEYKLCAVIFLRIKNIGYEFKVASNVRGLGGFYDVFVEYLDQSCRKKHIFVQLKLKARRITMSQLKSRVGDFSLRKYYDSYIQVEEKFSCSEGGVKLEGSIDESLFITYTNTGVQELKANKSIDCGEEEFLMTGGTVLQFNEEEHKAIYQHLQDLPKHREFLSRFRIFYSQADEKEMDTYVKPELEQIMKLSDIQLDIAYMCFREFITDCCQNSDCFLQDTNSRDNDPL